MKPIKTWKAKAAYLCKANVINLSHRARTVCLRNESVRTCLNGTAQSSNLLLFWHILYVVCKWPCGDNLKTVRQDLYLTQANCILFAFKSD